MKLFFISDIHGSIYYLNKALEQYKKEDADYLIILGDILYHGARNPLPKGYEPREVIEVLNQYADKIIAVRGNCDSEVDQMVLNFPIMAPYSNLLYEGRRIFLYHGHLINEDKPIELEKGSIFISGHTHLPVLERRDDVYYINPGSITLPKENNPHSYGVLKDGVFEIKDLEGKVIKELKII